MKLLQDPEAIAAAQQDEAALERLLPEAEDLVWWCYWRRFGGDRRLEGTTCLSRDDIFQEGMIGFLEAVRRFESGKGCMFTTYAVPFITGRMYQRLRQLVHPLHLPRSVVENMLRLVVARDRLADKLGREPTPEEVHRATGMSRADALDVFRVCLWRSLQDIAYQRGHDGEPVTVEETVTAEDHWQDDVEGRADFYEFIRSLPPRLVDILFLRLRGRTQTEIAQELGMSQANVCRLLRKVRRRWEAIERRAANA